MKRDALIVGVGILVSGIAAIFVANAVYVAALVNAYQTCNGSFGTAACATAQAQANFGIWWMIASIGVFLIGVLTVSRAFTIGDDRLLRRTARIPVPPGRYCPTCKTFQQGAFCANDGTKLA